MQITDEIINNKVPLSELIQEGAEVQSYEDSLLEKCTFHP